MEVVAETASPSATPCSRREMDGPPDISDILNIQITNVNVDLNSGFSESEVETSGGTRKHRTLI